MTAFIPLQIFSIFFPKQGMDFSVELYQGFIRVWQWQLTVIHVLPSFTQESTSIQSSLIVFSFKNKMLLLNGMRRNTAAAIMTLKWLPRNCFYRIESAKSSFKAPQSPHWLDGAPWRLQQPSPLSPNHFLVFWPVSWHFPWRVQSRFTSKDLSQAAYTKLGLKFRWVRDLGHQVRAIMSC